MLYVYSARGVFYESRRCVVCNSKCDNCHVYGCLDCNVYVHLECIPLPRVVKHEAHSHTLVLSDFTNLPDDEFVPDDYFCLICEKKGNYDHPYYHCQQCSELVHIDCVLSEVVLHFRFI